ncbi:4313_t:CDS:1, partial [Funneliformis geosporum]
MSYDCLINHLCHFSCSFEKAHITETLSKCVQFASHVCDQIHACEVFYTYTHCAKEIRHKKTLGNSTYLYE